MPLTINVGLSRKASRNYQSSGTSINLTAELDQALLQRPGELQARIEELYRQAEDALERRAGQPADNPDHRVNGRNNGRLRPATAAQRRAIEAIATRLGLDPADEARRAFGWAIERLHVEQASDLIRHLEGLARSAAQHADA